jgi:hypothetical protein
LHASFEMVEQVVGYKCAIFKLMGPNEHLQGPKFTV